MTRLAVLIAVEKLGHGKTDTGRYLFRLTEIDAGNLFQRRAVHRHDALIGLHALALIDGEGEYALTKKLRRRGLAILDGSSQCILVVTSIGAKRIRRGEISHEKIDGSVALGLNCELAIKFQRSTEQCRQHQCFCKQPCNRRRIIMATQNGVEKRPKLHRTATNIQALDLEGNNPVISGKVEVLQFHGCFRHHLAPSHRSSRALSPTFTQTGRQAEPLGRSKMSGMSVEAPALGTARLKADKWCRLQANSRARRQA
ncbi:hypothetical protein D3C80_1430320 [compost metagenome]